MSNTEQIPEPDEVLRNAIVEMTVVSWRFGRAFARLLSKLDFGDRERYESQLRWFTKKLEETLALAEMKLLNIEGQPFDPGTAATPLNIEDFDSKDILIIEQMIEPIILGKEGIIRAGNVILRRVEK